MKLSWTAVYDGMWKNGDGKTQGGREGGKTSNSQCERGSTAGIIYLRVAR